MTRNFTLAVLGMALMTACEASPPVSPEDEAEVDTTAAVVTTLILSHSVVDLGVGSELTLAASPRDALGAIVPGAVVEWTVGRPDVADVSSTGLVRARGPGSTQVTARTAELETSALVRVSQSGVYPQSVTIEGTGTSTTQGVCRTAPFVAHTGPINEPGGFVWSSSDPQIAMVDSAGTVTGFRAGTATITAAWGPDTTIRATRQVTIVVTLEGRIAFQALRQAGTQTLVLPTQVSGVIEAITNVAFTGPDSGELQVLLDSTILQRAPYVRTSPCSPSTMDTFFVTFDSSQFAEGPHELRAWVLTTAGENIYTSTMPIVIVR